MILSSQFRFVLFDINLFSMCESIISYVQNECSPSFFIVVFIEEGTKNPCSLFKHTHKR